MFDLVRFGVATSAALIAAAEPAFESSSLAGILAIAGGIWTIRVVLSFSSALRSLALLA
jgi:hypothetical protein